MRTYIVSVIISLMILKFVDDFLLDWQLHKYRIEQIQFQNDEQIFKNAVNE